jgi:cytoskeletal protein CcmA (bactofilin family)
MREERGTISGDVRVFEPFTLWGSISGNVTVIQGGKFYVRGSIYGSLTVEYGGRVHIFGNVSGKLTVMRGAKVIHSGVVGGDALNDGGRLYIESMARILGELDTINGETRDDRPQPASPS